MNNISRRSLLKLSAISGIVGILGYSRVVKPQPTIHKWDTLELPRFLSKPKKVVVIGGGLAGLASAYELSSRGFEVTLLEKSPQLGGKIASWDIQVGNDSFRMEHGFHGFFPQYYNLKSIVKEVAIESNFQSLEYYSVVFKGDKYKPENFRPSHSSFPWNIVDLAISSRNSLHWGINLTNPAHWRVFHAITSFKIPNTYYDLDNISVADWAAKGIPQGLFDLYFLPFAKSSLNAPDVLSTGELMQFFHFYFFGNPEGLAFNGTVDDMGRSLVEPIAAHVVNNQGKIITEANISKINCRSGKITSIEYYQGDEENNVPFWVDLNPLLKDEHYSYYGGGDRLFAVVKDTDEAFSLSCTHQGCIVNKQEDGKFVCPCHGAVYDQQGKVLNPPAKRNLKTYKVIERGENQVKLVANQTTASKPKTIEADYFVFATDVVGTKHLFNLIEGDTKSYPETKAQIESLALADPFAVGRFWLDKDFEWRHSNFASLSGYRLTDSITLYHRIQNEYKAWAEKTGGSVVELHAYCYKEKEFPTQEAILNTFREELIEIVPELADANILHQQLVNQKNFSGYPPNSFKMRPSTESQISNLMFAGDWVKMPFPCGLMERAISSGLLSANAILYREGLQRRDLLSVNPSGLFSI
ncbi:FAD-dependent oxidoreductase [Cyanobacterium aponinum UTEX 3222]|uniref:FAD-dependent oxidoreductase n=1 Tax=Cyanobacterium aponinum 0216 TaxID=2676140 RepID=A0A844GV00_9CHRO|nr:FAD-dependent oxidoreductase [Cyanobacterium aponinum]MTF38055.1 FAD-dependent oxidoreductase [Cyanobacterium aponinum 0216]WRL42266.1 FAD-dependent oxidoreductase [Cyanobacterium aponinum UTEX 3222]